MNRTFRWFALSILLCIHRAPAERPSPNFLVILADDMGPDMVGAYGGEAVTPHIDRLVGAGVSFMNAYNPGSWQPGVCVASRTMLMTGRSLFRAQAFGGDAERMWPRLLQAGGYRTYMTGKWHVAANARHVFEKAVSIRPGMPSAVPEQYNRPLEGQPDPWSPSDPQFGGFWTGGRHWSEVQADHAIDLLSEATAQSQPFFLYVCFNAPHDPRQAPAHWVERYPPSEVRVPDNFLPVYPYRDEMGAGRWLRDERLAPFPRTDHAIRVHRSEFNAITSHMDEQIGRVLDALEATGAASNTVVIFSADHGLAVGQHGLMGKQNMYDHSMKVPLILVGPGLPENQSMEALVYLQDIMPTVLDLAGVPVPEEMDFRSLQPMIRGDLAETHPALFGAYMEQQRMVREGDWKLIVYPTAKRIRLFNVRLDPLEMNDLAEDPAMATVTASLMNLLRRLQEEQDDTLDLSWLHAE